MIELILVMTIMTLLGLFAAMMIWNVQDHAKTKRTIATIRLMEIALGEYKRDIGHYPLGDGTNLASCLTETGSAWKRAGLDAWFPEHEDVKDAWGMLIQYCSSTEYTTEGRGVERTPQKGDYYNLSTFQIYSYGPNMKTWPETVADGGHPRLCGTEPDDIRNWVHEKFCTPSAYP